MEAKLYNKILSDKDFFNLKKLQYKYSKEKVQEVIETLNGIGYTEIPLNDFKGQKLVYIKSLLQLSMNTVKLLLTPQTSSENYGIKAMEEEIYSTLLIENINSSRNSIRNILNGYSPKNDEEERIYGMKKGLEFISNRDNKITEENLYKLYKMTIGDFLEEENKLLPDNFYRHDDVYIMGSKTEHKGLPHTELNSYMKKLIEFINSEDDFNDLWKGAVIHFYIGYIHPYFDGNGRTARLVHLWYLVQRGYSSALYIPFSSYINTEKNRYYNAYTITEENQNISCKIDVTPFISYFIENVYNKLGNTVMKADVIEKYKNILEQGKVTEKEKELWNFVISAYGNSEFSTKQLEKDFRDAAYATVRAFVMKFEEQGLLYSQRYGNRVKYKISDL